MDLLEIFIPGYKKQIQLDELPVMSWKQSRGIVLGKVGKRLITYEPFKDGYIFYIWGSPGSGKSSAIVAPTVIVWHGSLFVLDLKSELAGIAKSHGRMNKIKYFSIMDPSKSSHFDPLIKIRRADDDKREKLLGVLSHILIPDEPSKDAVYFVNVARGFFMGIFLYVLHKHPHASFSRICMSICNESYMDWGSIIEDSKYELASKYTNRFKNENPNNVGGGYSKLSECLQIYTSGSLKDLLANKGDVISPADLDSGKTDIYVQIDPTELSYYAPLVAMLFEVFMSETLERRTKKGMQSGGKYQFKPCAFVLDEFGQLPAMPAILQMATLGRGYNCNLLIACQSLGQIDEHYGTSARKTLMDCARGHAFLSIMDVDTQKWASELIGKHKVLSLSSNQGDSSSLQRVGYNTGFSYSDHEEPFFEPDCFSRLVDEKAVVIWIAGRHIRAEKTFYYE